MHVGIVGINHKSASLSMRESLSRAFQKGFQKSEKSILLSTCNRTELYFTSKSLAEGQIEILATLREVLHDQFEHLLYSYFGPDCFHHLGRVVSGIDSVIIGESDIQRQVKLAYEAARLRGELPYDLHYLFQKALKIGKEIRTTFLQKSYGVSLPSAIESLFIECRIEPSEQILFVGNSSINRTLMRFLKERGWDEMALCTRMKSGEYPLKRVIHWDLPIEWSAYRVIICATDHDSYLLKEGERVGKSPLLIDLSMPRNIDPSLAHVPGVKLYNIDQIGAISTQKKGGKEISLCETIVEKKAQKYMQLFEERKKAKWRYAAVL